MSDPLEICLTSLRDTDRDRYLACLLSPTEKRGFLAALYAFNAETARIRELTKQPLAGEIRLQWWRDLLEGDAKGDAAANPVASGLLKAIEVFDLPRQPLLNMLDARIFDLYDDPMPDRSSLEGYAGETASALLQLAAMILDREAATGISEIAGHAGVAQAISGILLLMPIHRRRGQVYLPQDILRATGLDRDMLLQAEGGGKLDNAIRAFVALGHEHLDKARSAGAIPKNLMPAFLPVSIVPSILAQADRKAGSVLTDFSPSPQWLRQIRMLRGLIRNRI
ncbi:phytoene/squalene synthase family protein [Rhizobium rhizoryzae]|uniref:Phytoene synthase n=1 Tax=Rhizobium rhizoryzae TaxID=451876 RepID=A0A7W6LDD7_9HYPH|nr:phytoene/squalene synthase family protein [Rhizobium rhizoryzae]MBB4142299.1 phytoene synthase [Rhizobium rhizoryzae]